MAGVISPSPYSSDVPNTPSITSPAARRLPGVFGITSAVSAQDAALAAVVGAHDEADVLDRDDDDQRPERDRCQAQRVGPVDRQVLVVERLAERVQRAGPDVAEHHTECAERQRAGAGLDTVAVPVPVSVRSGLGRPRRRRARRSRRGGARRPADRCAPVRPRHRQDLSVRPVRVRPSCPMPQVRHASARRACVRSRPARRSPRSSTGRRTGDLGVGDSDRGAGWISR